VFTKKECDRHVLSHAHNNALKFIKAVGKTNQLDDIFEEKSPRYLNHD